MGSAPALGKAPNFVQERDQQNENFLAGPGKKEHKFCMNPLVSRRSFLKSTALVSVGLAGSFRIRGASPNEKLNIAVAGIHNQGRYNLDNVSSQNIVAMCDVDSKFLDEVKPLHPGAKTYEDFRKMLEQKDIEAVVVATPDHNHAIIATSALASGRHVYCEKPLTRTLSECRAVQNAAAKYNRVTQIGTQIHAGSNYRRVVELVQSGAIGKVDEVHVWSSSSWGNKQWPKEFPPVPANLNYDMWLGPIQPVPYHPDFLPFTWRNYWAFGNGSIGDFGCHFMDLPHWALKLKAPISAVAEGPDLNPHCPPEWLIVHYEYPAREEHPAVRLTWYHGGKRPEKLPESLANKWTSGVLFVGEKGMLLADYGRRVLLPEEKFKDFKAPDPFIPESIGHHKEWFEACKTGGKTTCSFDYSGPLTEAVLLGDLAFLAGNKIEWDSKALKAKNNSDADKFIQHHYRNGWALPA
jgi:predicted dehydrogenase